MPQKYSRMIGDRRAVWLTENLWRRATGLPVARVSIDGIKEFDMNCWFDNDSLPTCRSVSYHALKISRADLAYPIILSSDGSLMDGGHRVCKAWMAGFTEIDAVRFTEDPSPDYFCRSTRVSFVACYQ